MAKDRAANWANKLIDDSSGFLMKEAVHILEWLADQPLTWTLIAAVMVVLIIFLHAYFTNERPSAKVGQPTFEPPPLPLYRAAMEFHVIASLACGKTPILPINSDPELQMLRHLKDAATDGRLQATNKDSSGKFYALSQTTSHDLLEFCERHPKPDNLLNFARQWVKEVQPRHYVLKAEPGAYRVTGLKSILVSAKQEPEFISLQDAAVRLYESSLANNTLLATAAERLSGISPDGGITAGSPNDRLDYLATHISRHIPVYGKKPPSGILAKIAASEINRASFNDGATVLRDNLYNKSIFWTDLAVKSDEFNSKINEMILRDEEV